MKNLTKKVIKIVKRATKIYFNKPFNEEISAHKFANDSVTDLDIKVQNYLVKKFSKLIKNSGFLCEENFSNLQNKEYVWVIDPIDGTYNYKMNMKCFGTQVALTKDNKTILSVLCMPALKETFYADETGAYLNGKKLHIDGHYNEQNMAIAMSDFNYNLDANMQKSVFEKLYVKGIKRRIVGSACFEYCETAAGRKHAYVFFGVCKWDLLPGQYLVKQAGGYLWDDEKLNLHICGTKENVEKVLKMIGQQN